MDAVERQRTELARFVSPQVAAATAIRGTLSSPGKINDFLKATTNTVSVDKTLDIISMATQLRHLRSGNLHFYTSPSQGTGMIGDQSVVLPDTMKAKALFKAVRKDDTAAINSLAAG